MTIKSDNVQVGQSGTASQNFTLLQNNDGTFSITRGNAGAPIGVPFKITANDSVVLITLNTSYTNDAAAAAAGIPVGGIYQTAGAVKVRLV